MLKSSYKTVCKVLRWVILIGGIVGSVVLADKLGVQVKNISYLNSTYTERNTGLTAIIFISGTVSSIITSTIFGALGEILEFMEILSLRNSARQGEEKADMLKTDESLPPL